jgi:hypothetical protein
VQFLTASAAQHAEAENRIPATLHFTMTATCALGQRRIAGARVAFRLGLGFVTPLRIHQIRSRYHRGDNFRPISHGQVCNTPYLIHVRGALLQGCSGAARGCKSLYAARAVTKPQRSRYSDWDKVESRFMSRNRVLARDLRHRSYWVPTSLYAPRRQDSKLTSDALFVSTSLALLGYTQVKRLYSQTTDYQVDGDT